jgi:hypothetical protein
MRSIKLFSFLLLVVALQSCLNNKPGIWKNDEISSGKRSDFNDLNKQLFASLKANDNKQLGFIESQELLADNYMNRQVDLISNSLKTENYKLLDEYYVVNRYKTFDTIDAVPKGVNARKLIYNGIAREMYIAFFVNETAKDKWLITATYSKYNYGWKLSDLDFAMYTINGKTAPELFEQAKEKYAKNYLVEATNTMQLAGSLLRPSQMWVYDNEKDISEFYARLVNEANAKYKFPIVLEQVPTHPRIFRVFSNEFNNGYYPQINYLSSIKLTDTIALKKENEIVKKEISNIFPGIDKDKGYIVYSIFNEMPSTTKSVDRFNINDKLQ